MLNRYFPNRVKDVLDYAKETTPPPIKRIEPNQTTIKHTKPHQQKNEDQVFYLLLFATAGACLLGPIVGAIVALFA